MKVTAKEIAMLIAVVTAAVIAIMVAWQLTSDDGDEPTAPAASAPTESSSPAETEAPNYSSQDESAADLVIATEGRTYLREFCELRSDLGDEVAKPGFIDGWNKGGGFGNSDPGGIYESLAERC